MNYELLLQKATTDFPTPIARLCSEYVNTTDVTEKYRTFLRLYDTLIRFLAVISLVDYYEIDETIEPVNTLIREHLENSGNYDWHRYFTEITIKSSPQSSYLLPAELKRKKHDDGFFSRQNELFYEQMAAIIQSGDESRENEQAELAEFIELYEKSLMELLGNCSFLCEYSLLQLNNFDADHSEGNFTEFRGMKSADKRFTIDDQFFIESKHLYLFAKEEGNFFELFPFILRADCPESDEKLFFFFDSPSTEKSGVFFNPEKGKRLDFQDDSLPCALGRFYFKKRAFQDAANKYRNALKHFPSSECARRGLVHSHEKLGNHYYQRESYYRAVREYEEARKFSPTTARILYNLSLAYKKLKDYDQAIATLNALINRSPHYFKAYEILGYLFEEKGQYAKSLSYYNKFLKHEPNNIGVLERRKRVVRQVESQFSREDATQKKKTPTASEEKVFNLEDLVTDLMVEANNGQYKVIVGREKELQEIFEVLSCMKKNNPLIVGEPGVGKTSLVEELARRIVEGEVPKSLLNKRILQLKAANLLAGTKFRGQFEERITNLIKELRERDNSILFIDDLHTIMNAGMTKGSALDTSNVLKPELAKGTIQMIGVCTYDEYRLYLEKDPAFERRFQIIKISEPNEDLCISILGTFKEQFELYHNVLVAQEAIQAAVELPRIYLRDRYLPDKAIDLLDRTCAMVSTKGAGVGEDLPVVTAFDVIRTVSQLTRIPLAKIDHAQSKRYIHMDTFLKERIIGQDEAIRTVCEVIRTAKMDFDINPMRPDGVFLFVGPTGVGKTELARAMALFLFGDEEKMLRIDMSEFTDDISTSKLIGITPGYVGYHDRNQLTDHVRNYPYSLILLDEVEKANRQVLNLFLQVFDSGRLTDGRGRTVYFNNTTFVMTSNIGAELFLQSKVGYGGVLQENSRENFHRNVTRSELLRVVNKTLLPEFINRIDEVVFFRALNVEDIKEIAMYQLSMVRERLRKDGKELTISDEAIELIVKQGYSELFGARNLARTIRKLLLDPIAMRSLQPEWESLDVIEVDAIDESLKIL